MIKTILNKDIELIIEYSFKNKENLRNSLTHPSSYKDKKNKLINNLLVSNYTTNHSDGRLGLTQIRIQF